MKTSKTGFLTMQLNMKKLTTVRLLILPAGKCQLKTEYTGGSDLHYQYEALLRVFGDN